MSEDFNLDVTNTAGSWYGTQMKPEIFEPFTAEWGGRIAKNAGWLFARQDQTIFCDGKERPFIYNDQYLPFQLALYRRAWLNEAWGTLIFRFNLELSDATDLLVVRGTLRQGYGNGWYQMGTFEGSHTTEGWKSHTIYLDRNWYKINVRNYGDFRLFCSLDGLSTGKEAKFWAISLTGLPRT